MAYRLTRQAEIDVIQIYVQGARDFGAAQAEAYHHKLEGAFARIAAFPQMARERPEISPPVRIQPCGRHIVVYVAEDGGDVLIIRIRHGHEDWAQDPD